ncbi:MAG: hypothetical protein WEC33_00285, partial [Dehalococcoidia bacterium]
MADFKVGSFQGGGSSGAQAITGLGFTPKAILFFTSGSSAASGTWAANFHMGVGFTAGASNSMAAVASSQDAGAVTNSDRGIATTKCIHITDFNAGIKMEASLVSFDGDGFTINWSTASSNIEIMYLAIGGAGVSAKVVSWTEPTTGTNLKALTGVGFVPHLVFHAG